MVGLNGVQAAKADAEYHGGVVGIGVRHFIARILEQHLGSATANWVKRSMRRTCLTGMNLFGRKIFHLARDP